MGCAQAHHCSYKSIGPEIGEDETESVDETRWLFEGQSRDGCIIVSPSWEIPQKGTAEDDDIQPPHRQSARRPPQLRYSRGIDSWAQAVGYEAILDHSEGEKSGDVTRAHYSLHDGHHFKWPITETWVSEVEAQVAEAIAEDPLLLDAVWLKAQVDLARYGDKTSP